MAAVAISKYRKMAISQQRFNRSLRNLVLWHMLTLLAVLTVNITILKNHDKKWQNRQFD